MKQLHARFLLILPILYTFAFFFVELESNY